MAGRSIRKNRPNAAMNDKRMGDPATVIPKLKKVEKEVDIKVIVHNIGGVVRGEVSKSDLLKAAEGGFKIGAALSKSWKSLNEMEV